MVILTNSDFVYMLMQAHNNHTQVNMFENRVGNMILPFQKDLRLSIPGLTSTTIRIKNRFS